MKVLFFHYSMQAGGAERTIALLANHFIGQGDEVEIMTMDSNTSFYRLESDVKHICLGTARNSKNKLEAVANNIHTLRVARQEIQRFQSDVVICFDSNTELLSWLIRGRMRYRIIGSERANPCAWSEGTWDRMRPGISTLCDGFIFQTKGAQAFFPRKTQKKSIVLPNMIDAKQFQAETLPWEQRADICAVGRMDEGKCFADLLRAFSQVLEKHPEARLDLYGDGPERKNLEALAEQLGLQNAVSFCGKSKTILREYARHKIFVMTSQAEGMPNVLMEALASGCACVSTDCDFGPSELIQSGENGFLVPVHDIDATAKRLCELLGDDGLCRRLGAAAIKIRETHDVNQVGSEFRRYLSHIQRGRS